MNSLGRKSRESILQSSCLALYSDERLLLPSHSRSHLVQNRFPELFAPIIFTPLPEIALSVTATWPITLEPPLLTVRPALIILLQTMKVEYLHLALHSRPQFKAFVAKREMEVHMIGDPKLESCRSNEITHILHHHLDCLEIQSFSHIDVSDTVRRSESDPLDSLILS